MIKKLFIVFLLLILLGGAAGALAVVWGYYYFSRDLPRFSSMEDYRPVAATQIFSSDGTLIDEFYRERRYPVKLDQVPQFVRNTFLAAEDASFYNHPGIDPISILRAFIKNVQTGTTKQGGSTITQQVVKNLLLTREKSLERKIKEAILAYRIEKKLTKDQILEIYLTEINFGNRAYGIKAAAQTYFHKTLDQLTLAEAAMLAGLPKAPSRYSPIKNFKAAKRRQKYVLGQMVQAGFVPNKAVADQAYQEEFKVYSSASSRVRLAPYYTDEVRRVLERDWKDLNIETDGLKIYTPLDLWAYNLAVKSVRKGLGEVDKRRGWRGPLEYFAENASEEYWNKYQNKFSKGLEAGVVYPALVEDLNPSSGIAQLNLGAKRARIEIKKASWAKKRIDKFDHVSWIKPERVIRPGDVIEVSVTEEEIDRLLEVGTDSPTLLIKAMLNQTPLLESALTLLDPNSGKVVALVGGYDYDRSVFNRATQALRQPGSAFKPIVYLAALDAFGYTPATIVYDQPRTFKVGDGYWTPANYDKSFLGGITLRTALQKSRNLISADIISRIGVDAAIRYAAKLGIESRLGRNLSLSLGSSEVTVLEMARAYGVFAARGILFDSVFMTRVLDRNDNVLFDYEEERLSKARRVIRESSAFVMAYMMKGVVENGTGYRVRKLGRPTAGKTGTTNELMDAWFLGYTPEWVCGVWTGFDEKKKIGVKETGGRVSAPIWLYFMTDFLKRQDQASYAKLVEGSKAEAEQLGIPYEAPEPLEPADFAVPDGVEPFWINKSSGGLAKPNTPGAFLEYFIEGTEPKPAARRQVEVDYWDSDEL